MIEKKKKKETLSVAIILIDNVSLNRKFHNS